ncbi:MAG: histidine phosphatase family protein [Actinomycetota bacterium]
MERVILARHGESEYNPRRLVNGDPGRPVHLTARGREEAAALAGALAAEPIDLCVVTEFPRTHETADVALAGRDVPRIVLPALNDPRFGSFEGRPIDEVRAFIAEHGTTAPLPGGGEARVDVIRRYCAGYEAVAERPEGVVLVVAHGLPVMAVWLAARGEEVPVSLHGMPDAHGEARSLVRDDLMRGVERMREWIREQEAAAA